MSVKKESGPKRLFATGANKQASSGKGTPVLFPGDAYLEISKHFEDGAEHYGARNWEKGIPLSELINSLERHIAQEKLGMEDESHARAIAWNAVVYLATKVRIKRGQLPTELADIPGLPKPIVAIPKFITRSKPECATCQHLDKSVLAVPCITCDDHFNKWEAAQ